MLDQSKIQNVQFEDGLHNLATGLGTVRSKREHSFWTFGSLNDYQRYEASYQESWLARRICDVVADDVCKEWRAIKCKNADDIRIEEDRLGVVESFRQAIRWARLYGGAGIVMITDQDITRPLDVNRIGRGSLKRLLVLDRFYLGASDQVISDILDPDYLKPKFFIPAGAASARIHTSHVVKVTGEPLPLRWQMQTLGWGDSSLRQAMQPVEDYLASIGGVAESLQEFNVDIVKRENLFTDLSTDRENAIIKRFTNFGLMKSIVHLAVLDGSEDYERKAVAYGGVPEVIDRLMHLVSGATNIPYTKLFGASAAGMDATGEGDERNYKDFLLSTKTARLDPALRFLDEVLVRSALGAFPADFNYEWPDDRKKARLEKAQAEKVQADTDLIYLDAGVVSVSQVQRRLQANETYSFDDDRIAELEEHENQMSADELYGNGEETDTANRIEKGSEGTGAGGGADSVPKGSGQ
jgi:phage-related protein (TIGR01555 family)|nr:MAG TPA: portal [Caudoviricetes sp.]